MGKKYKSGKLWGLSGKSIEKNEELKKEFFVKFPELSTWLNNYIPLDIRETFIEFLSVYEQKSLLTNENIMESHCIFAFYSDFNKYIIHAKHPNDFDPVGHISGTLTLHTTESGKRDLIDGFYTYRTLESILDQVSLIEEIPFNVEFKDCLLLLYYY